MKCLVRIGTSMAVAAALFACVSNAPAASGELLSSGTSTAVIDFTSAAGMNYWNVGGLNQLNQQWFWYRIGSAPEASIHTISVPVITRYAANDVGSTYNANAFSLSIRYRLTSPDPTTADIIENIQIKNNTAAPLDFHFFQYSDFNLAGTPGGDSVMINYDSFGGGYDAVTQTKGAGLGIAETINDPVANHAQAALTPVILNLLNDAVASTLDDTQLAAGPGDATWALQWDFTIPANGSVEVFKDKHLIVTLIPEPSSLTLAALGMAAVLFRRFRR